MKNPYAIALASALITAGAIRAAPALAEPASGDFQTYVSYVKTADLDLSSEGGQRAPVAGHGKEIAEVVPVEHFPHFSALRRYPRSAILQNHSTISLLTRTDFGD